MPFRNRSEAGQRLAVALARYKEQEPAILALPRGGVAVAAEVAAALDAPLDLILVRKIGVPFQPELAMGAVVDGGASIIVRNEDVIEHVGIDEDGFKAACDAEFAEIERRRERYLGNRERAEVAGRTAIVIDDGVATGATTRVALRATRMRNPKQLVLAVPVAPSDSRTKCPSARVDWTSPQTASQGLLPMSVHWRRTDWQLRFLQHNNGRAPNQRAVAHMHDKPAESRMQP